MAASEWFMRMLKGRSFQFARGARAWERGEPCAWVPLHDAGDVFEFWSGWRMACAMDYLRRCEIAEQMGDDRDRVRFQFNEG